MYLVQKYTSSAITHRTTSYFGIRSIISYTESKNNNMHYIVNSLSKISIKKTNENFITNSATWLADQLADWQG